MTTGRRVARARGLVRAVAMSYGTLWRRRRMVDFHAAFLAPGDLAFDLGAHAGNRVRVFRRLGARVVAVEPQPDLVAVLRRLYGRDDGVAIEACAVGAENGEARLHLSTRTPTVSTLSRAWMDEVRQGSRFDAVRWDRQITVPLVTLDELVARHGEPRFCKIDVEGFELEVLTGLSRPLASLSFEYIPVVADRAVACVDRTRALGDYRYALSPGETLRWSPPGWLDADGAIAALRDLRRDDRSGDVYAVRADVAGRRRG